MPDLKITELNANTTPALTDLLPLADDVAGTPETQAIELQSLMLIIDAFTAESTVDGAADFFLMYDTSESAVRKVLADNFPIVAGVVKADGTVPLTADWDAGAFEIRAQTFESDVTTGTAPLVVASTTVVANLNADKLDGTDVNDAGSTTSDLWTASKITSHVAGLLDGRDFKPSVRVATTADGTLATAYENGDTVDGVTLATGDRILIKDQSTATENGIYEVQASGAPTRASDLDTGDSAANAFVTVEEGTANVNTAWICPENVGSDVVGTDTITFTNYAGIHVHATSDITSGTFADARIAESNVTQHEAALTITESQISDLGTYLTDITGEALSTLADVTITSIASGEALIWNGSAWINQTLAEAGIAAASHTHTASDIDSGTLAHERGGIEADISGVAIGDVLAGTGTGTMALVTSTGHSDGDVLTIQADGTVDFETPAGGGSGGLTVTKKTADYNPAVAGDLVVCDAVTIASFTVTMPAAPSADQKIGIYVEAGAAANTVTVAGNGKTLSEFGSSLTMQTPGDLVVFQYDGVKWVLAANGLQADSLVALTAATTDEAADFVRLHDGDATEDFEKKLTVKEMLAPYIEDSTLGTDAGDLIFRPTANDHWTNLKKGTDGDLLTMVAGFPAWADPASGVLNKYDATTAPVVGDDSDDGYSVGSHWYDITADVFYVCLDATVGAAVWQEIGNATHTHTSTDVTDFETEVNSLMDNRATAGLARVVATSDVVIHTKDISLASYSSDDVSVVANPNCCEMSADGLRLYVTTSNFADVRSYDLSVAWDISTAVADYNRSMPVDISDPAAVRFKPDGTQMFVLDQDDQYIYTFNCVTAWIQDTATLETEKLDTSGEGTASAGFVISPDGDRVFVLHQSSDTIHQYNLTTPWDMSTGSYASKSKSVAAESTSPTDIVVTADGKTLYLAATDGDKIYQYDMTVAWDISTATYASNLLSVATEETHPTGLALGDADKQLFVGGTFSDQIHRYSFHPGDPGAIDSVTLTDGDRVLLTGQTLATENGIWIATTAILPETWTRAADMATADTISGRLVAVTAGTTNAATLWVCTTADGSDVVGTDDLTFTKMT